MSDSDDELTDTAFRERVLHLAGTAGVALSGEQLAKLARYFNVLRRWNRAINLTALPLEKPPDRTFSRLFIEPLQAAPYVAEGPPLEWFDLGSGGGSPAIPLKVARPDARLTMVESRSRKAAFLREVSSLLSLTDTRVLAIRIEALLDHAQPGHVDLITARAVRVEGGLVRTAATLLRPHGRLLLFGSRSLREGDHGLQLVDRVALFGGDSPLQVLRKMG